MNLRLRAETCALLLTLLLPLSGGCNSSSGNHDIPPPPEFINGAFIFAQDEHDAEDDAEANKGFDWNTKIEFEAPNRSRTNPFVAGIHAEGAEKQVTAAEQELSLDTVRVKGFVQVDKLRVFLRVGDDFRSLGEGESLRNVTVLKIQPPRVTLLRDGEEETRSLMDEPTEQRQEDDGERFVDDIPAFETIETPPGV